MLKIEAFQCSICGVTNSNEHYIKDHEDFCIAEVQYELKRHADQNEARAYLGTFRTRAKSIHQLIHLMNEEMDEIVDAHNIIENYTVRKLISPLRIVTTQPHGFATPRRPKPKPMTHSAPVGKKTYPMWPRSPDQEQPLAFELELQTEQVVRGRETGHTFDWLFTHIAGVNQGGGGSWHDKHNANITHHHYITFWVDDWCDGFG